MGAAIWLLPSYGSHSASLRLRTKSMGFTSSHVEAASTLAVIAFSNEPLSFLAGDLRIIAASASFCRTFKIDPASVPGRQLSELGAGEWAMPKLASLLKATASGSAEIAAYEIDLVRNGVEPRYLVVNARKLDDGDDDRVRLLLAVSYVTFARAEARQKDDLIREKAILLQEVQHRVANSLQIKGDEEFQEMVTAILRSLPLERPSVLSAQGLRHLVRIADGITARVFGVLNELAIDAVETGAECISDTVIETWKPAIEKEAAFA
jgi:hypothetical protein